jgi:hypothetical protein
MIAEDRSYATLNTYTVVDALSIFPISVVAAVTQTYFAHRSWLVSSRSIWFAIFAGSFISLAFLSALALLVMSFLNRTSITENWSDVWYLMVEQIFLWASVMVDLSCSVVLLVRLLKLKRASQFNLAYVFRFLRQLKPHSPLE